MAEDRPVPGAVVEVRWDATQARKPVTVATDAAGRFHVAGAPPEAAAAIRVRAGAMVNANVAWRPQELAGPLTVPVSAGNAFRIRGRVTDGRGHPVGRAKVVVTVLLRPAPPAAGAPVDAAKPAEAMAFAVYFQPAEVEALFTDAAGRFESGALWPNCVYVVNVSADGLAPRRLREIEAQAGQVHELPAVVLNRMSGAVAGTVVGTDGQPLAGVTVLNSGDGPKRLTASTDAAGRFQLTGLYDGPAVVVAHKPGYRWAYAVARPGAPEPKLRLRSLAEPPEAVAPISDEHTRADAELVRRLAAIVAKDRAARPQPPAGQDPWAAARKDLDVFLANQPRQPHPAAACALVPLATELAKEDRVKALRVLREAAAMAKRVAPPAGQAGASFQQRASEMTAYFQVQELTLVAIGAAELGFQPDATGWLAEAEALALRLSDPLRHQQVGQLAVAWVTHDPARAEKLLAVIGDAPTWDVTVSQIIRRLVEVDPHKAVPWLGRFKQPDDETAQSHRALVAVRLADRDWSQALRMVDEIRYPAWRAATLARLAAVAPRDDGKLAHDLIDKAAAALATEPKQDEREPAPRMGVGVYLLWKADAVKYPDKASLVALALTTRPPVRPQEDQANLRHAQTVRLAAGVGSLDPQAGRALLGRQGGPDQDDLEDPKGDLHQRLLALALVDPAAAGRLAGDPNPYSAAAVLHVLRRRSAVIRHSACRPGCCGCGRAAISPGTGTDRRHRMTFRRGNAASLPPDSDAMHQGNASPVPVPPREAAYAVTAGFLGWTLDAFDFFLVPIALPTIAADLGVDNSAVAASLFLTLMFRPVGAFLFGLMADRYGRRLPMMLDLVFFSLVEVATAFAPDITTFLILRALFGIGMGGEWGVGASLVMEKVPAKWRGLLSGFLQEGYAFGYLLAAAAAFFLLDRFGWRPLFLLGGAPALLALFIRFGVKESAVWQQSKAESWSQLGRGIVGHWRVWLYLTALMAMLNFAAHGTQDMYPTFLEEYRGLPRTVYAQVVIIMMLGAILGGLVFGLASDRFGRRRMMIVAFVGALAAVPLWAFAAELAWIEAGAFLMQFMIQGAWGVIPAHISELSPDRVRGFLPGFAYQCGNLVASSIGWVQSLLASLFAYSHVMALSAAVIFVGAIVVTALGRERRGLVFGRGGDLQYSDGADLSGLQRHDAGRSGGA
jgi:SHS family lactate transporter-like MFS transporter